MNITNVICYYSVVLIYQQMNITKIYSDDDLYRTCEEYWSKIKNNIIVDQPNCSRIKFKKYTEFVTTSASIDKDYDLIKCILNKTDGDTIFNWNAFTAMNGKDLTFGQIISKYMIHQIDLICNIIGHCLRESFGKPIKYFLEEISKNSNKEFLIQHIRYHFKKIRNARNIYTCTDFMCINLLFEYKIIEITMEAFVKKLLMFNNPELYFDILIIYPEMKLKFDKHLCIAIKCDSMIMAEAIYEHYYPQTIDIIKKLNYSND